MWALVKMKASSHMVYYWFSSLSIDRYAFSLIFHYSLPQIALKHTHRLIICCAKLRVWVYRLRHLIFKQINSKYGARYWRWSLTWNSLKLCNHEYSTLSCVLGICKGIAVIMITMTTARQHRSDFMVMVIDLSHLAINWYIGMMVHTIC